MTRILSLFILLAGLLLCWPPPASADVGPKPSLEIIVRGLDTTTYWLDLLVTDEARYTWLEITPEEREKVTKLAEYRDDDGFHPALLGGTRVPLNGKLHGEKQADGSMVHRFSYVGVPKTFKIAILKDDGSLIISPPAERKLFQSVMVYDLRNLEVSEEVMTFAGKISERFPWQGTATGFFFRLAVTLLIELLLALLFGFRQIKSLQIITITNTATQVILNLIILFTTLLSGLLAAIFFFVIAELLVIAIELTVYLRLLPEKSRLRRTVYTFAANLSTIAAGLILFFI